VRTSHAVADSCTIPANTVGLVAENADVLLRTHKNNCSLRSAKRLKRRVETTSEVIAGFDDVGSISPQTCVNGGAIESLRSDERMVRR
jgi:hypothetical protein